MKRLAQVFVSACLSLALMAGVGLTLTGCSADTLSGPDVSSYAEGGGTGTGGTGSDHNTDKAHLDGGGTGTGGTGSDHNTDG